MKFVYIGGKEGPESTIAYGLEFERNGEAVEVVSPVAIAKLSGNAEFRAVIEGESEEPADDREALAAQYEQKFGKRPHHKLSAAKIAEALNADNG